jgi:ATP-dependent protease ClpP protease subunit
MNEPPPQYIIYDIAEETPEDMERDIFMSAKEAKVYGIVDLVAIENAPNS